MKNKIGVCDCLATKDGVILKSYEVWRKMISRCYDPKSHNFKNYGAKGVKVCKAWFVYSNFKKWFDKNYIEGCVLDKDLKQPNKTKKIYSPKYCVFITPSENSILAAKTRDYSYNRGSKSWNAKPKSYYKKNHVERGSFKKVCERQGWIFENFTEVFAEHSYHNGVRGKRRFYYKEVK